jgi:phosphatidylserine decarboxylase
VRQPYFVWRQHYLPHHLISQWAGKLANCKISWFKNWAIRYFIKRYQVNINEALDPNPVNYPSFQDFFIRPIQPNLRPIDPLVEGICSPCDGTVSQIGTIEENSLLQAKGRTFSLEALLGDKETAKLFTNGRYVTIYLAPKDYHRVHMPYTGILEQLRYIPGKLFSVNPVTAQHIDSLFAQNERVVTLFKNERGSFAMLLVGAMIVGNISTRWSGSLLPHRETGMVHIHYPQTPAQHIKLDKGEEMGYFSLGSTVILLFSEDLDWEQTLAPDSTVVVGQRIGRFIK